MLSSGIILTRLSGYSNLHTPGGFPFKIDNVCKISCLDGAWTVNTFRLGPLNRSAGDRSKSPNSIERILLARGPAWKTRAAITPAFQTAERKTYNLYHGRWFKGFAEAHFGVAGRNG